MGRGKNSVRSTTVARSRVCLILLGSSLGYSMFWFGGTVALHANIATFTIAAAALLFWAFCPADETSPATSRVLSWLVLLLPLYVAFQIIPLPDFLLRVLSPARAELASGLRPMVADSGFASLSVLPSATLPHLVRVCSCVVVFLLLRRLTGIHSDRPWILAAPIITLAGFEAALGVIQYGAGGPGAIATGTYVNRNHFSGLMEMALPFAVLYSVAVLRRRRSRRHSPVGPAAKASAALILATLMLVGILFSLSRMGFVAALGSLALVGLLPLLRPIAKRRKSWAAIPAISVALVVGVSVLGFVFLPSNRLVNRFAEIASTEEITAEGRLELWSDTLELIGAYPLFGCGLGAYESAMLPYNRSHPLARTDYAHNDYLQLLAELGAVGFLIAAALAAAVLSSALRAASAAAEDDGRYLGLACVGAIAAMLVHSSVDFNLYIPANALVLAWISGISAGLASSARAVSVSNVLDLPAETT